MDSYQKYLSPETLAQLSGLEVKARLIVEGFVSGLHQSPFHGFSIEFAEHREYVPGDDLRYVDWKVFAKTDRFYLKQYEEETNYACYVLLDTSESMRYRSDAAAVSKLEYGQYLAAALGYLVLRQQDAVGLATFDQSVKHFLRASSLATQLKAMCQLLEQTPAAGESSLGPIFHDLAERVKKRGLMIVISDFFDDVSSMLTGLKHFRHRRHDVILMQIIDPAEQEFPFRDPTLFKGLEIPQELMTDPRSLRAAYRQEFEEFLTELRRGSHDLHLDYVLARTDQDLGTVLSAFLATRSARLARR